MKSRTEKMLDAEFEKLGVTVYVYHFRRTNLPWLPFTAISIATTEREEWGAIVEYIKMCHYAEFNQATTMIKHLKRCAFQGMAICDLRDTFNRQTGRNKAKGRLLQHLLKEAKKSGEENV